MKFKKAPIVYQGNKFRLLKKIEPFFPRPEDYDVFVDAFGGSSVMSLNFGKKAIYNELNVFIKDMIRMIYLDKQYLLDKFNQWVVEYDLIKSLDTEEIMEEFKNNYHKFRDFTNSLEYGTKDHIAAVYTCHIFAINNLIRFNKDGGFNASSGFRKGNTHPIKKLEEFTPPSKTMTFQSLDFEDLLRNFVMKASPNPERIFIYLDPPYLNTTAVYNENRLTGWNIDDDYRLFKVLDELDAMGFKWAFSNTFVGKHGIENTHLKEWAQKYNINYLDHNYASFGNSNQKNLEVLITNEKNNNW